MKKPKTRYQRMEGAGNMARAIEAQTKDPRLKEMAAAISCLLGAPASMLHEPRLEYFDQLIAGGPAQPGMASFKASSAPVVQVSCPAATHYVDWEHIWSSGQKSEIRLKLMFDEHGEAVLVDAVLLRGNNAESPMTSEALDDVRQSFGDNSDINFKDEAEPILTGE